MSEPKVLHLITRFLSGGAEKTVVNEIDALIESGNSYDIRLGFGNKYDSERVDGVHDRGVQTVCFNHIRHYELFHSLPAVLQVKRYLESENVDVIHTHSTEAGIIGRFAAALARTPVTIHEIHGDPVSADRIWLLNFFITVLERIAARYTTTLIAKSELIRETYLDRGIGRREQFELIYHGVDLERYRVRERERSSGDRLELLFVGRLAEGKGLQDLLDAVERLDTVRLRIVGNGPMANVITNEIDQRGLPVDLVGYRTDIPEILANSDVLVLPSYREGTPRVITEALAAGCPVVATNIGGIPDQVSDGQTGYLVEPGDIDSLVARIRDLRDDNTWNRFSSRGYESVEKFSLGRSLAQYRRLVRELLEG